MKEIREICKAAEFGITDAIGMVLTVAVFVGWLMIMPW